MFVEDINFIDVHRLKGVLKFRMNEIFFLYKAAVCEASHDN